jgi:molecular chaperone IbpA
MTMRTFDLTPLFRSTIGFDRFDRLFESAFQSEAAPGYPPYNIEKLGEDRYRITMAVAGFGQDDLDVTVQENTLLVSGQAKEDEEENARYLHRGIARRAFERRFELADTIKVKGADLSQGLLHVHLVREVPESLKPKQIKIVSLDTDRPEKKIDGKAAA